MSQMLHSGILFCVERTGFKVIPAQNFLRRSVELGGFDEDLLFRKRNHQEASWEIPCPRRNNIELVTFKKLCEAHIKILYAVFSVTLAVEKVTQHPDKMSFVAGIEFCEKVEVAPR